MTKMRRSTGTIKMVGMINRIKATKIETRKREVRKNHNNRVREIAC